MDAGAFYGLPGLPDFPSAELNPAGRGVHRSAADEQSGPPCFVDETSRPCFIELIGTLASIPEDAPVFHAIRLAQLSGPSGEQRADDAEAEDVEKVSGKKLDPSTELLNSFYAYAIQAGTTASTTPEEAGLLSEELRFFSLSGAAGEQELPETRLETAGASSEKPGNSWLHGPAGAFTATPEKQPAANGAGEQQVIAGDIVAQLSLPTHVSQPDSPPVATVNPAETPAGDGAPNDRLLREASGRENSSLTLNGDLKAAVKPFKAGIDQMQPSAFAVRARPASEIAAAQDDQPKTTSKASIELITMKRPDEGTAHHNQDAGITPVSHISATIAAPADGSSRVAEVAHYASGPAADSQPPGQPAYTEAAGSPQLNDPQQLVNEPVREIQLDIGDQAERVRLQLLDKTGELRVHVRTSDETLTASLQSDLKTLVHDLNRAGFEAETWTPSPVLREERTPEVEAGAETSSERWQDRKDRDPDNTNRQPGERRHDKPGWPDWLDDFRQSFRSGGRK